MRITEKYITGKYKAIPRPNDGVPRVITAMISSEKGMVTYDLVILIPSARDNFQKRQVIRDTWMSKIKQNETMQNRVLLKFAVGSDACPYPHEDRLDPYGCEPWIPQKAPSGDLFAVESESKDEDLKMYERNYGLQYIPFKVDHPVVLNHLGIHQESLTEGATVSLLDAITQREIVSATFAENKGGHVVRNFVYKSVEPYLLPKDFEGILVSENRQLSTGRLPCPVKNINSVLHNSSALHFIEFSEPQDGHYSDVFAWRAKKIPVLSFIYSIHEVEQLRRSKANRVNRFSTWNQTDRQNGHRLTIESETHKDILIIDIQETYRNIPAKLLHSIKWFVENIDFHYMLKTDDDSFVDVDRILEGISHIKNTYSNIPNLWWGRFRQNWAVEHYGKWAERRYSAPVYPQFACGGGYVISWNITSWLSDMSSYLQIYQGEDTSMGIWLSAAQTQVIDDPLWQCDDECISDMYAAPNFQHEDLEELWSNKMECGDPCGCS